MSNETEKTLDERKIILKILQDKWKLAGKPKDICVQLKEFEFGGKISPDNVGQIIRGFYQQEKFIEDGYIFPTNIKLYRGRPIPEDDSTPFLTLYHNIYLRLHHLWDGIHLYNGEDKIQLDINDEKFREAIKKYEIDKFQFPKEKEIAPEITFDSLNGVINQGNTLYKIRSEKRLTVMKKLWEEQKIIEKATGKTKEEGLAFPMDALIRHFESISLKKEELKNIIKGLNRTFRKKGFPIVITMAGGVQLVIER